MVMKVFVEVFQNCIVYNDGVYGHFTDKTVADDQQIVCRHGEPLIFGKEGDKGLRFLPEKLKLEVIDIGKDGRTIDDVLVHDETNKLMAQLLASLKSPDFPTAIGVLYCEPGPTYDDEVKKQLAAEMDGKSDADFNEILKSGSTWAVD